MVLESLVNPTKTLSNPYKALIVGIIYALVSGLLAALFFQNQYASMVMVAFASLLAAPFMFYLIAMEEKIGESPHSHFLIECKKLVGVLALLIVGLTIGFTVINFVAPGMFAAQELYANPLSGAATQIDDFFISIMMNNLKVLAVTIVFSFLFGLGGIFVIAWNTSVLAYAIGNLARALLPAAGVVGGTLQASLTYIIHGIPELLAYFIAGIAGSMISVTIVKQNIGQKAKKHVIVEASQLMLLAFLILLASAIVEVFVIPLFL